MNQKELKFLTDLQPGQKVKVLVKDSDFVRDCTVTANMPSIEKIELQYVIVDTWTRVYKYSEVAKGIIDLNKKIPPPPAPKKEIIEPSGSNGPQKPTAT